MAAVRKRTSQGFIGLHSLGRRVRRRLFTWLVSGGFGAFGAGSTIEPPTRLVRQERIAVGDGVFVGAGCVLQVLEDDDDRVALWIGDGTEIAGSCVLSAAVHVRLGSDVLLARNVYVSDHIHAYDDPTLPVLAQGIAKVEPVEIGDGAWLGQNVVVCPGVTIGAGAVVGANSVVVDDVPPGSLAVGAPARVVRSFAPVAAAR